jgi:hypothetical protein
MVDLVRPGAVAALVVLEANPVDDIRNTQRIRAVAVRGRTIDAAERTRLLAAVEAAAHEPPVLAGPSVGQVAVTDRLLGDHAAIVTTVESMIRAAMTLIALGCRHE